MEKTENQALFSELTTEEAETVNGASHRRRYGSSRKSIHYSSRRNRYQEECSRRNSHRNYGGTITFTAVVRL